MKYTLDAAKPSESISKEISLAPGINSFCVDKFGQYNLKFSGCHTYDSTTTKSFKTGIEHPMAVNAVKHRNGVRIVSDTRTTFKVLSEQENGEKHVITFAEAVDEQHGANQFVYRYNFDLKQNEKLTLTPQGETVLFAPQSKEISGAADCIEVCRQQLFLLFVNFSTVSAISIPSTNRTHSHSMQPRV